MGIQQMCTLSASCVLSTEIEESVSRSELQCSWDSDKYLHLSLSLSSSSLLPEVHVGRIASGPNRDSKG